MSKSKAGAHAGKSFGELDSSGKLAYVGKVLVFLVTFGFAFPTIFSD
ncbi:MAG: hypothetical protein ACM3SS_06440 [Rhodospirillaceae bacterium]